MIKIGVTGGIGSGKTTFCKVWEKLGAHVVYADDLAKKLMVTNSTLKDGIIATFSDLSYHPDGSLNTQFLAKEAFSKGRVEELNKLVHPVLWSEMERFSAMKEREGCKLFVHEAAILLQNGRPANLDYVVLITASKTQRTKRVSKRDNTTEELVHNRMNKQPDFDKLVSLADFVITNDGTENELEKQATSLFKRLISQ